MDLNNLKMLKIIHPPPLQLYINLINIHNATCCNTTHIMLHDATRLT